MKFKKEMILFVVILLFLISLLSAVIVCDIPDDKITLEIVESGTPENYAFSCTNGDNETYGIGILGNFYDVNPKSINAFEQKDFTITFNQISEDKTGFFVFGDGYKIIEVDIGISEGPQGCIIDIFPSILSNVKVQQGESKSRNIQLSVPSCYTSPITVNGIALQSDERPIMLGEISIGTIQPGNSVMIPIEIDATDVSTGSYQDVLQFLLYDNFGNKINVNSVSISVMVTAGITPLSNFSLTDLPTCSLDAIDLAINQTYTLTCSRTNPNIDIEPIIDYLYIRGLSVSETSSQYIYSFEPKIIGLTEVGAKFKYKNAELGNPYLQDVRISPSGNAPAGGITTKFSFYQAGIKKEPDGLLSGETIILILDNSTGNILPSFTLYVNGLESNNTFELKPDKLYELRVSVPSYLDNVVNFTVSKSQLTLTVEPSKTFYFVGDEINISSNVNGTSFLFDGSTIEPRNYVLSSAGNHTIKVSKDGYQEANETIEVKSSVTLNWNSCSTDWKKWKKGRSVTCDLSQNASWEVYLKNSTDTSEGDGNLIAFGEGKRIDFEPNEHGLLVIKADDLNIGQVSIEKGSGWYKPWTYESKIWEWIVYIGIAIVVILIIYFGFIKGRGEESESGPPVGGE